MVKQGYVGVSLQDETSIEIEALMKVRGQTSRAEAIRFLLTEYKIMNPKAVDLIEKEKEQFLKVESQSSDTSMRVKLNPVIAVSRESSGRTVLHFGAAIVQ